MANYANLKATIDASIKQNGNEEITGPVLNSVLNQMVTSLISSGYVFSGYATPVTSPGTPDGNVFYLAQGAGTYTDFGNLTLGDGLYALLWNGSWTAVPAVDWNKVKYTLNSLDFSGFLAQADGTYIASADNKWYTSETISTFFLPVAAGLTYRVTARPEKYARFAVLRAFPRQPSSGSSAQYATGESLRTVSAGTYQDVTIPSNGYFMIVYVTNSSGENTTPSDISVLTAAGDDNNAIPSHPRFITPRISTDRRLDARTSETTFGQIGAVNSSSLGVTQAFPVKGARMVRFFAGVISTSSSFYGRSGGVFYDKNMVPVSSGVWLIGPGSTAKQGWMDVAVPSGAEYFVYEITAGAQQAGNKVEIHYLDEDDFSYSYGNPSCPYTYYGDKIDIRDRKFGFTNWAGNNLTNNQGSARYGDYLITVTDYLSQVMIYSLPKKDALCTLTTGITQKSWWHCNQLTFTDTFYDEEDYFPVLYVSMQNDGDGRGECIAFRIVPTWTDNEISSFTFTQVQNILLPVMSETNALGNPNFAFDPDHKCFWIYSRNNDSAASNYRKIRFSRIAVPALWDGDTPISSVSLQDSDILESFGDDWDALNAQGAFIKDGLLYLAQGTPSNNSVYFKTVDLYGRKRLASQLYLSQGDMAYEPESPFIYDGQLLFTVRGEGIMRLMI